MLWIKWENTRKHVISILWFFNTLHCFIPRGDGPYLLTKYNSSMEFTPCGHYSLHKLFTSRLGDYFQCIHFPQDSGRCKGCCLFCGNALTNNIWSNQLSTSKQIKELDNRIVTWHDLFVEMLWIQPYVCIIPSFSISKTNFTSASLLCLVAVQGGKGLSLPELEGVSNSHT